MLETFTLSPCACTFEAYVKEMRRVSRAIMQILNIYICTVNVQPDLNKIAHGQKQQQVDLKAAFQELAKYHKLRCMR